MAKFLQAPTLLALTLQVLKLQVPRLQALTFHVLILLAVAACASSVHQAPAPGDAEVVNITAQWLAAQRASAPARAAAALPPLQGEDEGDSAAPAPYRLGAGDVLAITVWDHPELGGAPARSDSSVDGGAGPPPATFVIDQQGQLHFPFAGALTVAGLTREQARAQLAARLSRYLRAPRVTMQVHAYRSQRVVVAGEVRTPGVQAIDDIPMTLREALSRAGGLQAGADSSRITVERAGQRYLVDLARAGAAGTLLLADGDYVRVPPRDESKVFVGGEVLAPRALTMHDGRLTLNEALGEAGGFNPQSADAGQVYVVRQLADGPRVFRLDARPASALALAEQFELRPRDVVYVAASPLSNWHRAISQLFPGELSSTVGAIGSTTRP